MPGPRISVNKLGEYLTASPTRRRRIVEEQKAPKPFITTRYSDAREEIVRYVAEGMINEERMIAAADRLRESDESSNFTKMDKAASADAIESFLEITDKLDIEGTVPTAVEKTDAMHLELAGVSVSVRPEVILKDPKTGRPVGAIKLHFPKTTPLDSIASEHVAALLKVSLDNNFPDASINAKRCIVVDVSTGSVVTAPKATKRRIENAVAACEEIHARWER